MGYASGGGGGTSFITVANYAALPDPTTVADQFYNVLASQGTRWFFTYKPKGIYYSDGVTWDFRGEFPSNAPQATVDAGTDDESFVTPKTLTNSAQLSAKEDTSNKSNSLLDVASTSKFPVWAIIVSYFSASQIKTILGISTLSGSNTGDDATNTTSNTYADGKVADAINDGETAVAPSQNAVFDALALKAPLLSPVFSGTPSLPTGTIGVTQATNDNSTKLATTAYVKQEIDNNVATKLFNAYNFM